MITTHTCVHTHTHKHTHTNRCWQRQQGAGQPCSGCDDAHGSNTHTHTCVHTHTHTRTGAGDANEVLNSRAVAVMTRMSDKLMGRDYTVDGMSPPSENDSVIAQVGVGVRVGVNVGVGVGLPMSSFTVIVIWSV